MVFGKDPVRLQNRFVTGLSPSRARRVGACGASGLILDRAGHGALQCIYVFIGLSGRGPGPVPAVASPLNSGPQASASKAAAVVRQPGKVLRATHPRRGRSKLDEWAPDDSKMMAAMALLCLPAAVWGSAAAAPPAVPIPRTFGNGVIACEPSPPPPISHSSTMAAAFSVHPSEPRCTA